MAKKVKKKDNRTWQQKLADGFCKHMNAKEDAKRGNTPANRKRLGVKP